MTTLETILIIYILLNWFLGIIVAILLKQAQKQEKLLELYRKLMTAKDEFISLAWFDDECDEAIEIDLEKQIKELENDI